MSQDIRREREMAEGLPIYASNLERERDRWKARAETTARQAAAAEAGWITFVGAMARDAESLARRPDSARAWAVELEAQVELGRWLLAESKFRYEKLHAFVETDIARAGIYGEDHFLIPADEYANLLIRRARRLVGDESRDHPGLATGGPIHAAATADSHPFDFHCCTPARPSGPGPSFEPVDGGYRSRPGFTTENTTRAIAEDIAAARTADAADREPRS